MKFNTLLLIDCFGEEWINKNNPIKLRQFYANTIDYLELFSFDQVLFSPNKDDQRHSIHEWFKTAYPNAKLVDNMQDVVALVNPHTNILVGGAAWDACLHKGAINYQALQKNKFNVYSCTEIVDSFMYSSSKVTDLDFEKDNLNWQKVYNFWMLGSI